MKRKLLAGLAVIGSVLANGSAIAQDVHFSQFWEPSVLRNPALVGIFTGDYKAGALYRTQWNSISKPFQTALVNAELRVPVRVSGDKSDFLSFGLVGFSDVAGSLSLRTTGVYPAVTYNKSLEDARRSYLSAGFTAGYLQRSYDASKMTFDNQWTGSGVNTSLGPNEALPNSKLTAFDLGAGVSFSSSFGEDDAATYFVGLAAYHLTKPKQSFAGDDPSIALQTKWSANAGAAFRLQGGWRLELQGNLARQGAATEVILGGMGIWQRTPSYRDEPLFSLGAGLYYRYNDAVVPAVRVAYKTMALTAAYDVNVSTLRAATALRGAYEIGLAFAGVFHDPMRDRSRTTCPKF